MLDIVIWGTGRHSRTVTDVARAMGEHHIVGFLDDINSQKFGREFCGARVLGGRDQLQRLSAEGIDGIFVAIGDNQARVACYQYAADLGYQAVTLIHPFTAIAADCEIGAGTIIRAGAVVEADVAIGRGVIVGAQCALAHGCRVDDAARIAIGSVLSGDVRLERGARIGPGCTILNEVRVGQGALLGAGSVLIEDLPPGKVAVGCPARVIRDVTEDDC